MGRNWHSKIKTTPGGFEPPSAKHTHLAGEPLNHSGKAPIPSLSIHIKQFRLNVKQKKQTSGNHNKLLSNIPYERSRTLR